MKNEFLRELEWESTHNLVFLTIVTLGIFPVFYIRRQSEIFNTHFESQKISNVFILVLLTIVALSAVLTMFSFINLGNLQLSQINNLMGLISWIMTMFWAFKFRNKINKLFDLVKGNPEYFKSRYTILFHLFYINYKINQLTEQKASSDSPTKNDA